jgi:diaminohydroxyphosphoribosylaminopyrimidine deaminase/5-amino-6-(5-phosphoribosylamino)uracil reductase
MTDPNPKVAGGGLRALEAAGIETRSGVLEPECRYLNRAFIKHVTHRRPWLALKMACTLDGRIADRKGRSRWITGQAARNFVHELRDEYDAVMVGGATAVADDPELTVRGLANGRDPYRVVIDAALTVSPQSRLAQNQDGKTMIFASQEEISKKAGQFKPNVRLIPVGSLPLPEVSAADKGGPERTQIPDRHLLDLDAVLSLLAEQEIVSVLCEGGSRLAASLLEAKLVDEVYWLIAPKLMCDAASIPAVSGTRTVDINDAVELRNTAVLQLGNDVLLHGLLTIP